MGRVYFTQSAAISGNFCAKDRVVFEALPQGFAPTCQWRAIAVRKSKFPVHCPSVKSCLGSVSKITDTWGCIATTIFKIKADQEGRELEIFKSNANEEENGPETEELAIFFTVSDWFQKALKLADVTAVGEPVQVAFVPQTGEKGFKYR